MLNLVQRLCGISTETKKYTQLNTPNSFKVMDTRKMTPGLRKFEKYAVYVGGGWNHRLDLSSGILIKICLAVTERYLGSVTAETL